MPNSRRIEGLLERYKKEEESINSQLEQLGKKKAELLKRLSNIQIQITALEKQLANVVEEENLKS